MPTAISGTQLWLDAADNTSNSITFGTGNAVATWRDKSGNDRDISQNTISSRPTFEPSLSAVRFSNTVSRLDLSAGLPPSYDILTVGTPLPSNVNAWRTLLQVVSPNPGVEVASHIMLVETGTTRMGAWFSNFLPYDTINWTNQRGLLFTRLNPNLTLNAAFNGTTSLTAPTTAVGRGTSSSIFFGNNGGVSAQPFGDVNELILNSNALSTSDRQRLEGYLAWKWGLTSNLPSFHPHRWISIYGERTLWQPSAISGLQLWLDAMDVCGNGVTQPSNGASISTWIDKSGATGRDATSTLSVAPTYTTNFNGAPAITFPGGTQTQLLTTNSFSVASSSGLTWFAVAHNTDTANGLERGCLSSVGGAERSIRFTNYANANAMYTINGGIVRSYAGSGVIPANGILMITETPSSFNAFVNGGNVASSTTAVTLNTSNSQISVGRWTQSMSGHIREILIYNRALDSNERQRVEGYLAGKWGLISNLPNTGHPFRTQPPFGRREVRVFDYTGSDQSFQVPTGVSNVRVMMWGAGGGGGDTTGGAGAYIEGNLAVTSGETLGIVVGQGGNNSSASTYGGGGGMVTPVWGNRSGGGRSAIRRGATELCTAGGGGGCGSQLACVGGSARWTGTARDGGFVSTSTLRGRGATQTEGGARGTTNLPDNQYGGQAGTQFAGGRAGEFAGGGGGGWYGGGGGATTNGDGAGGGGGSSYTALLTNPRGENSPDGTHAPRQSSVYWLSGIGNGGAASAGGNGRVVIEWDAPT